MRLGWLEYAALSAAAVAARPRQPVVSTDNRADAYPNGRPRRSSPVPRRTDPWRLDWATLLHRVHDIDALACDCGGRLRFVDLVTTASEAKRLLAKLGRLCEPQPVPRACARDPTETDFVDPAPLPHWE